MADNFDWRTEEDGEWEGPRPVSGRAPGRRRWLLPLAIVATLLAAAGTIYWQVQQRVDAAEAAVIDDVRSSFWLIRQAVEDGDVELFRNLLSGAELEWAAAQQELFSQEWLFDLSPFGLSESPQSVADVEVTLSPQLNSAEVTAVLTYGTTGGRALSSPVRLQQTSVFRRGERWIWSPPREEFWAGVASVEERYLSATYPTRDEALVLRLARDLDLMIAQLCDDAAGLGCPDDLKVALVFSREPGEFVAMSERFDAQGLFGSRLNRPLRIGGPSVMSLPTPSLLGAPLDENSYQALLNGYGAHLAIALAGRLVDEACCGTVARFRAAARDMLLDLGLDPWFGLVGAVAADHELADRDEVALLCSDGFQHRQRLFVLDLSQMTWQEQLMAPELLAVKAMPGGDGVLLLGQIAGDTTTRSQVWHHSTQGARLLFDIPVSAAQAEQISWELQEQQDLMVVEVPDLHRGYSSYFTIDLAGCERGDCPTRPQSTVSRPVWSPDGSQLMVRAYGLLWWRVGPSMIPIADGSAPFWVDEDRYGYVRTFGQEQAVVVVEAGQERAERVVLTTSDLRSALGPETRPGRLLIGRVLAGQDGGGEWLILAFVVGREGSLNQARLFVYESDSGEARLIPHEGRLMSFNIAPSRDKLAIGGFVEDAGRWKITVVGRDMAGAATATLEPGGTADAVPSYSWSLDETRLLILDQGLLTLLEPETGAIETLRPPAASCVQAAWYGRGQ